MITRRVLFVFGGGFLLAAVLLSNFLVFWPAPISDELDFKLRVVVWVSLFLGAPLVYFFSKKAEQRERNQ